jgi:hypothetical protein
MLLYLTVLFRPLLPYMTDAWEHAFNEQEHLVSVHAKQGNRHVERELANEALGKADKAIKEAFDSNFHLYVRLFVCLAVPFPIITALSFPLTIRLISGFLFKVLHPPERWQLQAAINS